MDPNHQHPTMLPVPPPDSGEPRRADFLRAAHERSVARRERLAAGRSVTARAADRYRAGPVARTRSDSQRRAGTLGELETVSDRLARVAEIWTAEERTHWASVYWFEEQIRRLAEHLNKEQPSAVARALIRSVDQLGERLETIGRAEAEVRGQIDGAYRHLEDARHSVQIDQRMADLYRLDAAGLDEWSLSRRVAAEVA